MARTKKIKIFKFSSNYSGRTNCFNLEMNGINVYSTSSKRDCDLFEAELKAKILMMGGEIEPCPRSI